MKILPFGKLLVFAVVTTWIFSGCSSLIAPPPKPLTQQEIVEMARAGATDEQILNRIRESRTAYRLTAAEVVSLHNAGVSFTVLDYMMQSYIDKVRADQRFADEQYWWLYYDHYYHQHYYPRVIVVPKKK